MVELKMIPSWDDVTGRELDHMLVLEGKTQLDKLKSRGAHAQMNRYDAGKEQEGNIIKARWMLIQKVGQVRS